MKEQTIDGVFFDISQALITLASNMHPDEFRPRLSALIGNVVGNMPEEYWQEFVKIKPCGRAGCDCHLTTVKNGVEIFERLRRDHHEHTETHSGAA